MNQNVKFKELVSQKISSCAFGGGTGALNFLIEPAVFQAYRLDRGNLTDGPQQHELHRGGNGERNEIFYQPFGNQTDESFPIVKIQEEGSQQQIQENRDEKPGEEYSW